MSLSRLSLMVVSVIASAVSLAFAGTAPSPKSGRSTPPAFEINVGQARFDAGADASYVDAVIRVNGVLAYIHKGGLHVLQTRITKDPLSPKHDPQFDVEAYRVDMQLIASNPSPRLEWQQRAPGITRYLLPGTDANGLVAERYSAMIYHDVWPGIDLRMYVNTLGVKYDFLVHPGADPKQIAFRYIGGTAPTVKANGDLELVTPLGTLGEQAPYVFQAGANGGLGETVDASFDIRGQSVRFAIEDYDKTTMLVVDPQRVWGTYYGFNQNIEVPRLTIDPSGNVITSGSTLATNMPNVAGVLQRRYKAGFDGFIAKFSEAGTFLWHTYYGGSKSDRLRDVTTDASGNIWACGQTDSPDLPFLLVGSGPYGDWDSVNGAEAIVLKLTPAGAWADSWQIYGRESDIAAGIAVTADRVAVIGYTRSPRLGNLLGDLPYRKDSSNFFNNTDIFLSVVKPKASDPTKWSNNYLIFYGGKGEDFGSKVAIDQNGDIILGGFTYSSNFPVTDGTVYKDYEDITVVKFGATPVRQWATMFGSSSFEDFGNLAVDATGGTVVVGSTEGTNFPTLTPLQATRAAGPSGRQSGFIRKLGADGAAQWSTYYGGTDSIGGLNGVAVDKSNNVWVAGYSNQSKLIPITPDAFQLLPNGLSGYDGYLAKLNPTGTTVLYGSFHGAPSQNPLPPLPGMGGPAPPPNSDFGADVLNDIICDANAYVAVVGLVTSYRMDTTAGAYQDSSKLQKDTLRANDFLSYFSNCKDSIVTIVPNGPATLCDIDSRQLLAPAGFDKYTWSTGGTARSIVVTDSGTYSVLCKTLDGCRYRSSIYIGRNTKPTVSAGIDTSACLNVPVQISATPGAGKPPFKYKWNRIETGPEFITDDTLRSPSVNPSATSRYEVTLTDSSGCIAKDTVLVTVINPKPTFAPALVNFGSLGACTASADAEITVTNPTTYELQISGFTPDKPILSLVTSLTPPIAVAPGASAKLKVRITPTVAGNSVGTFVVTGTPCGWLGNFSYTVDKAQLSATVIPSTVSFGAGVLCEQTAKMDSTVIRNGGTAMMVLQPGVVGAPFSITSPTAVVNLAPGGEQKVYFLYTPAGAGNFSDVAKFAFTSGSCSDTLRVNVTALTSVVTVTSLPSTIDIGTLSGCESERDTTITINNTSGVSVNVTLPATPEVIFTPPGPITIGARSTQNVRVTIRPSASGAFSQTSTLVANPCAVNVPVTFTAQKNGIAFTTPPSVDFGEFSTCTPGGSTTRTASLSFDGTGTATVASVTSGATLTTTLTNGLVLNPNQPVSFNVVWTPVAEGPLVDSIVITFEPCSIRRVIRVSGTRTRPSLRAENAIVALGNIPGSVTGTVRFTNNGTDTINISVLSRSVNTTITTTRPTNLTGLLPSAQVEADYQVNCAGRSAVADTIDATILSPCGTGVNSILTGTCSASITAQSTIKVDTIAVKVGDKFAVPIRITSSLGLNSNNLRQWTADLTYNPMVVVGSGGTTPDCFVAGQFTPCSIKISGTRGNDTVGTIFTLSYTAVLGTTDFTMLTLSNFAWTGAPTAQVNTIDGKVVITDICREGGDRYLLPKTDGFSINVFPTPASTDLTIQVKGAGTSPIPWKLSNYIGIEVTNGTIIPDATGNGSAVVDVRPYASGLYFLTMDARGTTYRNTVLIQR
ncbi:MAG: hypothetical protein NTX15_04760 [Candidatus Kapabacteria bacterium]|nr:hypothetical protein [Candidatus Kapabacteria bacterium]